MEAEPEEEDEEEAEEEAEEDDDDDDDMSLSLSLSEIVCTESYPRYTPLEVPSAPVAANREGRQFMQQYDNAVVLEDEHPHERSCAGRDDVRHITDETDAAAAAAAAGDAARSGRLLLLRLGSRASNERNGAVSKNRTRLYFEKVDVD